MGAPEPDLESLYAEIHDPELRATVASFGQAVAKREQERQAQQPEPEKLPAKVIQFPLFPNETRPVSNDMARSALFSCVQGKDRQMVKDTLLATVDGVEIRFTGEQFNQDDHDVLMQLVFMARHKPLGEDVTIPAYAILQALGRTTGGKDYKRLEKEIERLVNSGVSLRDTRRKFKYIGHLIDNALHDETTRHWRYKFNPDLRMLYGNSSHTLIDWEQRKSLRGKDLARWLQLYLATHAAPFPVSVEYLHKKSGSQATIKEFRRMLRRALDDLEDNGDIQDWHIDKATDLVQVDRGKAISDSQSRHLTRPKARRNPRK